MVYLITGKQDAGKSHYAEYMVEELREQGKQAINLDGDKVRSLFENDFSDNGRMRNLDTIAKMAALLEREGVTVVVSAISPKKIWRERMRSFWMESVLIYIPGGTLWEGTTYEVPDKEELLGIVTLRCLVKKANMDTPLVPTEEYIGHE